MSARALWQDAAVIRAFFLPFQGFARTGKTMALCWLCGWGVAQADWEVVTRGGQEYVTLKSFCQFYKLPYSGKSDTVYRGRNENISVTLKYDSREAFVNGVRCWLSFGVAENDKDWLIPRLDLAKLFEPVFRPWMVAEKQAVAGVVIDAGHGGSDNGASSRVGNVEKNYTLDTARRLETLLKSAGVPVVMIRRTDIFVDLHERADRASRFNNFIFVSLHYNFADASARGIETYCLTPRGAGSTMAGGRVVRSDFQKQPGNRNDLLNLLLADEVHKQVIKLNPGDTDADRGVKRARFVVLKENLLPSILVEGGFLTNRSEAAAVDSPEYRQRLAAAVARGIQNYIKLMAVQGPPEPITIKPTTVPVKPAAKPEVVGSNKPTPTPIGPTQPSAPTGIPSPQVSPSPAPVEKEPPVIIYPLAPHPAEIVPTKPPPAGPALTPIVPTQVPASPAASGPPAPASEEQPGGTDTGKGTLQP